MKWTSLGFAAGYVAGYTAGYTARGGMTEQEVRRLKTLLRRRLADLDALARQGPTASPAPSPRQESADMAAIRQDVQDIIDQFSAATTAVGARIQRLIDGQVVAGMSEADVATLKGDLQPLLDNLKALGTDPNNPVPPVSPPAPAP